MTLSTGATLPLPSSHPRRGLPNGLFRCGFPMLTLARYSKTVIRLVVAYSCRDDADFAETARTVFMQLDVPLPALVMPNMC
jgi:hypothetical protein